MRKQKQSKMPIGVLTFKEIDPIKLAEFKEQWLKSVSGVLGLWKTPIVCAKPFFYDLRGKDNRVKRLLNRLNKISKKNNGSI